MNLKCSVVISQDVESLWSQWPWQPHFTKKIPQLCTMTYTHYQINLAWVIIIAQMIILNCSQIIYYIERKIKRERHKLICVTTRKRFYCQSCRHIVFLVNSTKVDLKILNLWIIWCVKPKPLWWSFCLFLQNLSLIIQMAPAYSFSLLKPNSCC